MRPLTLTKGEKAMTNIITGIKDKGFETVIDGIENAVCAVAIGSTRLFKVLWEDADRASAIEKAWKYAQEKAARKGCKTSQITSGKVIRGVRLCNENADLKGLTFDEVMARISKAGGKLAELSEEKVGKIAKGESLKAAAKGQKNKDADEASDKEDGKIEKIDLSKVSPEQKFVAILEIAKTLDAESRKKVIEAIKAM